MPFGLAIGTDRADTLQQAIQDELLSRGYSPEEDPVMAEYITIMVINNKTPAQITAEIEDLIGSEFDPSFTDWLFAEAAKGSESEIATIPQSTPTPAVSSSAPATTAPVATSLNRDAPPHIPASASKTHPQRTNVYQQALSAVLPQTNSNNKRLASARSPSPNTSLHPNKTRRTGSELPTGPRAMLRGGDTAPMPIPTVVSGPSVNSRSLLDRVGGARGNVVNNNNGMHNNGFDNNVDAMALMNNNNDMMNGVGGFHPGMDMGVAMNGGMNPMMLQEMMINQMAMMAQMATSMGMAPGFAPGMPDMYQQQQMMMNGGGGPQQMQQQPYNNNGGNSTRGRGRGGSNGRGRGGHQQHQSQQHEVTPQPMIVAPTPSLPVPQNASATPTPSFTLPTRPASPTLCKFSVKCTNAHCRYSHPSPVASAESGVVLSTEACDKGAACVDKDCVKGHVSAAVLDPTAASKPPPTPVAAPVPVQQVPSHVPAAVPCRFGLACTRPACTFSHPPRHSSHHASKASQQSPQSSQTQCRFGAACTRATCPFQHPDGRVLPESFHRGLSTSGPMVTVWSPEAGTMGGAKHRSVTFNNGTGASGETVKSKLDAQLKELKQAEEAVKQAKAQVALKGKKEDGTGTPIAV